MVKQYPEKDGTGNYKAVVKATAAPYKKGAAPTLDIEIDAVKVPREPGDNEESEVRRRYSYDLVRSLAKDAGIDMHHYTGVDGSHFDSARMGSHGDASGHYHMLVGINPYTPEGKRDEKAAHAVAEQLTELLNDKASQLAAAPKRGRK